MLPWDEGYDAGMSGYVYDDNPYEEDTQDYRDWSYGRFCAEEDKEREEDSNLHYAELCEKEEAERQRSLDDGYYRKISIV